MLTLTSLQNPTVKRLRSLESRKGRKAHGTFLVEGAKSLQMALAAGWTPRTVVATAAYWARPEANRAQARAEAAYEGSEAVVAAIATTESPDGVVAEFALTAAPALPESWGPAPLFVVAHGLQDPGNLGTIVRAADAAGASAVVVTPGTTDPYAPKAVRSTMGSFFHLPILALPLEAVRDLAPGLTLYGMALAPGARALYDVRLVGPTAFVIGNEGAGLDEAALAAVDAALTIPMEGRAESLNAAMAATVCLFEAARQRRADRLQ